MLGQIENMKDQWATVFRNLKNLLLTHSRSEAEVEAAEAMQRYA